MLSKNSNVKKIIDLERKPYLIALGWFLIPFVASILLISKGNSHINNYLIFKNVFWHTVNQQHLYNFYPTEYFDKNHYGPFFSVIIAPFALLPNFLGVALWAMLNAGMLFYSINKLPLSFRAKNIILLISIIENLTSIQNLQFNPMLCGWIILTYVFIQDGKLSLAALFLVAGTLVKLYGIVGLAFIFFTKERLKLMAYILVWAIIFFCLPMLMSSPEFVSKSYVDWYLVLIEKNMENVTSYQNIGMTDISAMGFVRRVSGWYTLSNSYFILPAGVFTLLPLVRFSKWKNLRFQLSYLSQVLIGVVIFSTSAESPTYVIAVVGFAIWYVLVDPKPGHWMFYLLLFVLVLTVFSPTDLFPRYIRKAYVIRYSLKALPCLIAWVVITGQLLTSNFSTKSPHANQA